MLKQTLGLVGLTLSLSANAVIVNTLGGIDYQWLELSHTKGLSRNQVEARLSDVNDELYGYQYASRAQVEALFWSYATWSGGSRYTTRNAAVDGVTALIDDFGANSQHSIGFSITVRTHEGFTVQYDHVTQIQAIYGLQAEYVDGRTPVALLQNIALGGPEAPVIATRQDEFSGWDATAELIRTMDPVYPQNTVSSFLIYSPAAVPVPAAGWLFMSALVGLAGKKRLSRR